MPSSRRNFAQNLGIASIIYLAGCTSAPPSLPTSTDSTTFSTPTSTQAEVTLEPYSPELTVVNLSNDTHTVEVRLGEFKSVPDGVGTPIKSGKFAVNSEFKLTPTEEVKLREHRKPGEHYNFVLTIDGNIVVDEVLDGSEGLTITISGAETVDIQRTYV